MQNLSIYRVREENSMALNIIFATIFAFLTATGAMMKIYTPFTPVPITMQVFFVLLSGIVLGKYYGMMSQAIYAFFGFAGIPWFASAASITGGYILGFVFASFIIGFFTEKKKYRRYPYIFIPLLLGIVAIYIFGAAYLWYVTGYGIIKTVELAILPFIGIDMIKAMAVGLIAR